MAANGNQNSEEGFDEDELVLSFDNNNRPQSVVSSDVPPVAQRAPSSLSPSDGSHTETPQSKTKDAAERSDEKELKKDGSPTADDDDGEVIEIDPEFLPSDEEENKRLADIQERERQKHQKLLLQFHQEEKKRIQRISDREILALRKTKSVRSTATNQPDTITSSPSLTRPKLNINMLSTTPNKDDPLRKKIKGGAISRARRDFSPRATAATETPGPAMLPYLEFNELPSAQPTSKWHLVPAAKDQRFAPNGAIKPKEKPQILPFYQSNVEAIMKRVKGGAFSFTERKT